MVKWIISIIIFIHIFKVKLSPKHYLLHVGEKNTNIENDNLEVEDKKKKNKKRGNDYEDYNEMILRIKRLRMKVADNLKRMEAKQNNGN